MSQTSSQKSEVVRIPDDCHLQSWSFEGSTTFYGSEGTLRVPHGSLYEWRLAKNKALGTAPSLLSALEINRKQGLKHWYKTEEGGRTTCYLIDKDQTFDPIPFAVTWEEQDDLGWPASKVQWTATGETES